MEESFFLWCRKKENCGNFFSDWYDDVKKKNSLGSLLYIHTLYIIVFFFLFHHIKNVKINIRLKKEACWVMI